MTYTKIRRHIYKKLKKNYIYVQDMPKEYIHNCVPNLFPHISQDIYNLKI